MKILSLNSVESLSFTKTFNFLGDIFCYSSLDSYTLSSRVQGDPNLNLIVSGWSAMRDVIEDGYGYIDLTVHGVNLGTGKITSIDWEAGDDLRYKKFSMNFEVLSSGNLYNLTGSNYLEIDKSIFDGDFKYVNSIDESFSISMSSNGIQETSQEISVSIDSPLELPYKINLKNKIFSGFCNLRTPNIGVNSIFPNIITGNFNSGYISYSTESCDTVNNEYSFSKRSYYDNNEMATWEYSHSIDFNGLNIIAVENGSLKSIFFNGAGVERNLEGAKNRWASIKTGIFKRVSGSFEFLKDFKDIYPEGCTLIPFEISKTIDENPLEGEIQYSYTYTNDEQYLNSGYIFSNSRSSSIDEEGYYKISENGSYLGRSKSREKRFDLALSGYTQGGANILPRVESSFALASKVNKFLCAPSEDFFLDSERVIYKEFEGEISYDKNYSNNPSFYSDNSDFIFFKNSISDSKPVHYFNKFLIPNNFEVIQSAGQSTEGSYSNNIMLMGKPHLKIEDYLNEAFTKVKKPSGINNDNLFLKNMNYSFNPFENLFNATFEYYYTKQIEEKNNLI